MAAYKEGFCLAPAVSQPQLVYAQADLLLLSSRLDPFPLVAQEAMAAGLPVVCVEGATGTGEILQEDPVVRECVAPYLDVEAAAGIVQRMLDDPAWRADVGERNRGLVDRFFDIQEYGDAIEQVASEACAAKRQEVADREVIERSGVLEPAFLGCPLRPVLPEDLARWYVRLWASRAGPRKPFPGFHPGVYEELTGTLGRDPLAHYVLADQPAGPWRLRVIGPEEAGRAPIKRGRAALHIHVFYDEAVADLCERLNTNNAPVDLFITVPEETDLDDARRHWTAYRRGRVEFTVVPNRGRDIGALLTGLAHSPIWEYEFIGHLHTKRSTWLNNTKLVDYWRIFLLENTLGSEHPMMDTSLNALDSSPELGLIFPDDPYVLGWEESLPFAVRLAGQMGFQKSLPRAFNFPVGTFFWARTAALRKLRELSLQWEDYPAEPLPSDGTILHALERLFPLVAAEAGYETAVSYVPGMTR
jgi:hypothetical protein